MRKNFPFIIAAFILALSVAGIIVFPMKPLYKAVTIFGIMFIFLARLFAGFREGLLYLLTLIIPFHLGRYYIYPDQPNLWIGFRLVDFVIFGLYALWAMEKIFEYNYSRIKTDRVTIWSLSIVVLFSFFSCINAIDKIQCLYQSWIILRGILIFFYIAHYPIKRKTLNILLAILVWGILFQSVVGFLQWQSGGYVGLKALGEPLVVNMAKLKFQTVSRISGTLPSQNMLWFMYMDFALPLLAVLMTLRIKILHRVVMLAVFLSGLFVSNLAFSRGGVIGFFVAMGIIVSVYLLKARFNVKMIMKMLVIVVLSACIFYVLADVIVSRFISYDYGSIQLRFPLMRIAVNIIQAHPLFGVGAGNYILAMRGYDISHEGVASYFFYPVHNLYLFVAAEMGLIAFSGFIIFIASVLRKGWKIMMGKSDGIVFVVVTGLTAGLCAFCVHGLVESLSLGRLTMFWFCSGLIVNLSRTGKNKLSSNLLVANKAS